MKNAVFRYSPAVTKIVKLSEIWKILDSTFYSPFLVLCPPHGQCNESCLRRMLVLRVSGNKIHEEIISRQKPDSSPPLQGTLS